ncbi:hypothetical protein VIGAN_02084400 [Vigna angularis var. angularis]|uniref:Uncharacterized protein n=1 Tax=Vigna angularis var. angularis TaxID=157739 RepID=A0A0S3RC01_PHAAN|nr:hypothetical protein VIGAN_02084400 [Vigna angularis var. angularis]
MQAERNTSLNYRLDSKALLIKGMKIAKVCAPELCQQELAALVQASITQSEGWFFLSHPFLLLLMKSDMRWRCHRK